MDLIPKSHVELSSTEYWDSFFKKRGSKVFEWYGEYSELSGVLHKYIKPADKVLVVGCGNSRLSEDLYDIGYRNIVNIDIIDSVIKQMKLKNAKKRPEMVYEKMDMLDMEYKESDFNVVLDKSTLDAMMPDSSEEVLQKVDRMFSEINRVMKVGGRYICISLSQKHILQKVLDYFPNEGWMVRVHQVHESSSDDSDGKELQFPVFAFVCTKFKKMPQMQNRLLELCLDEDRPAKRVETTQDILAAVEERQNYAMLRHNLVKGCHFCQLVMTLVSKLFNIEVTVTSVVTLWLKMLKLSTIQEIDISKQSECSTITSKTENRSKNKSSLDWCRRRWTGHVHAQTFSIRKVHVTAVELDSVIVDVSKKWFGFVEDDRMNVCEFIEEKATEGQKISLLLIGVGGGGLAMFMHKHFPKVHVTAVELDSAIVDVSKKWFGFVEDDRMNVFVGDGLKFIEEKATEDQKNKSSLD